MIPSPGTKVRVHRNLHKRAWSVTVAGRVVASVEAVTLTNCSVAKLPSAERRALARGTRTVHAFIAGTVAAIDGEQRACFAEAAEPIKYRLPTAEKPGAFTWSDGVECSAWRVVFFDHHGGALGVQ